ncbi:MAG: hypothetical protein J5809_02680 [Selenomonadaceae bacterium]|nr:hypothetical protein [Selenomonadaceae bacterium]
MASFFDIFFGQRTDSQNEIKNQPVDTPTIPRTHHEQLLSRLKGVYKIEEGCLGGHILPFDRFLGYDEQLINQIPDFALSVLEKISDEDIFIATRSVLLSISHCPNCDTKIAPALRICPKCYALLPKDVIYFKGLNVMAVNEKTKALLKTISTAQIMVNGVVKNLELVQEKISNEIIVSLTSEVHNCPDCGMEITPPSAKYCWNCGSKIEKNCNAPDKALTISLPINDDVISALNRLAILELKGVSEVDYEEQVFLQKFCDTLLENQMATAQLCKKLGSVLTKLGEYDEAVYYYEKAMAISSDEDLTAQIEKLARKRDREA